MYSLSFAYPNLFYYFIPAMILVLLYRLFLYKKPLYKYPLATQLARNNHAVSGIHHKVFFILRSLLLATLIFLIARPVWLEKSSQIKGEGRDIVITIDVSGSMQVFDDLQDQRSRIEVAKQEAISFIKKRTEDPIGIVIFGADALSLSPLTLDKQMLVSLVGQIELGIVNQDGTSLGTGLATAVNRLRRSKAKTKIVILLTDGAPTPQTDKVSPETAIALAKQFGIKVYTIGIGSEEGGIIADRYGILHRVNNLKIDLSLLRKIADETGGCSFRANNPAEMKKIYGVIDKLEKTSYNTNIFQQFYEAFTHFFWIALLILLAELFLKLFVWRGI